MANLEERVAIIEARNKKVEQDKAWEISATRRLLIMAMTFTLIGIYLMWLDVPKPWLNALVPSFGFLLSTLAVHKIKDLWLSKHSK